MAIINGGKQKTTITGVLNKKSRKVFIFKDKARVVLVCQEILNEDLLQSNIAMLLMKYLVLIATTKTFT